MHNLDETKNNLESIPSLLSNILNTVFSNKHNLFFIDVGAYHGDFTTIFLKHYLNSEAILFEPTWESYEILQAKFKNNELIKIFNCALSDQEETRNFIYNG